MYTHTIKFHVSLMSTFEPSGYGGYKPKRCGGDVLVEWIWEIIEMIWEFGVFFIILIE